MDPRTNQLINEIRGQVDSLVSMLGDPSADSTVRFDAGEILTGTPNISRDNGSAVSDTALFTMLDAIARMVSCLQENKLNQLIVQGALDVTEAQRGFLMVMEDGSKLRWKGGIGITQPDLMSGREGSRSVIKDVVKGGKPVLRGPGGQPGTKSMFGNSLDSVLCIPIPIGKRMKKSSSKSNVAGILYVDSKGIHTPFSQKTQDLLVSYGKHVSIALENAWLYTKSGGHR
jgi:hypothetical protein